MQLFFKKEDCVVMIKDAMELLQMFPMDCTCRFNEDATELLPDYMKDFYLFLLKTLDSCEDELGPNKRYRVFYLKEMASID